MKYFSIEDERGGLLGYVKAKDNVEAYDKVLACYPGVCPDNRIIQEIAKEDIEKEYLKQLKNKELVEL